MSAAVRAAAQFVESYPFAVPLADGLEVAVDAIQTNAPPEAMPVEADIYVYPGAVNLVGQPVVQ